MQTPHSGSPSSSPILRISAAVFLFSSPIPFPISLYLSHSSKRKWVTEFETKRVKKKRESSV